MTFQRLGQSQTGPEQSLLLQRLRESHSGYGTKTNTDEKTLRKMEIAILITSLAYLERIDVLPLILTSLRTAVENDGS